MLGLLILIGLGILAVLGIAAAVPMVGVTAMEMCSGQPTNYFSSTYD